VTTVLGIEEPQGTTATVSAPSVGLGTLTTDQVIKCAAIAGAVADGNDRYRQALYDVRDLLVTVAAEAVGTPVVASSAERWVRVDAWPWPHD
jgi:hypothetical protein